MSTYEALGMVPDLVNEQSISVIINKCKRIAHVVESSFIFKMNFLKMLQSFCSMCSLCELFLNTHYGLEICTKPWGQTIKVA